MTVKHEIIIVRVGVLLPVPTQLTEVRHVVTVANLLLSDSSRFTRMCYVSNSM